jgi:protein O-mannosyl-transferase
MGESDAVKIEYARAISRASDKDDASCDLGALLFRAGDVQAAVLEFNRAATINPADPIPLFNLAAIFQRSDRPDLAVKLYERVLQLNPGDRHTI